MKLGQARKIPEITTKIVDGYAALIGWGWDTVAETFNVGVGEPMQERLERLREEAANLDEGEGKALIVLAGEEFQVSARRAKGVKWWLSNADFEIKVRSPKTEYCVSVRYGAAGLWQHGLDAMRERALQFVQALGAPLCKFSDISQPQAWTRISEAHWAWDFYSPKFSAEMTPAILEQVVCHSSVKQTGNLALEYWGTSARLETLTFSKRRGCEVQVYDKGREITEVSGKEWMLEVWEAEGYYPPEDQKFKDVWRLEVRLRSEFLRNRGILTLDDLETNFEALYAEALATKRLVWPSETDSNKRRWPMHPLWSEAFESLGKVSEMVPLGKRATEAPDARIRRLKQMAGGILRSAAVLHVGDFDELDFKRLGEEAMAEAVKDKEHARKVEVAQERYRYAYEAQ